MKGRHQFRRRFSLQPSFLNKEDSDNDHHNRNKQQTDSLLSESEERNEPITGGSVKHKIVVLGGAKVGKSSLISQFLYGSFSSKYKRTVEEMHQANFTVGGVQLILDILDTSGAYEFPAMRALSIQSADAFVLVYDITDSATFEEARALRDQIHEIKGSTAVPIVVVGNKIDLLGERQVDAAMTESVVQVDWENGFVETSAKENVNVSEVFKELLSQAKVKYNLSPALRRRRRQSLPLQQAALPSSSSSSSSASAVASSSSSSSSHPAIPSAVQLQHLQQLRDRHGKRNSCVIS